MSLRNREWKRVKLGQGVVGVSFQLADCDDVTRGQPQTKKCSSSGLPLIKQ